MMSRKYKVKEKMGAKVMTLNGKPMPHSINKSDDYYEGYKSGMEAAINIFNNGKPEVFGMKE